MTQNMAGSIFIVSVLSIELVTEHLLGRPYFRSNLEISREDRQRT